MSIVALGIILMILSLYLWMLDSGGFIGGFFSVISVILIGVAGVLLAENEIIKEYRIKVKDNLLIISKISGIVLVLMIFSSIVFWPIFFNSISLYDIDYSNYDKFEYLEDGRFIIYNSDFKENGKSIDVYRDYKAFTLVILEFFGILLLITAVGAAVCELLAIFRIYSIYIYRGLFLFSRGMFIPIVIFGIYRLALSIHFFAKMIIPMLSPI